MGDRRALVVGATGLTGRNTAEHLAATGWEVHGMSRHPGAEAAGVRQMVLLSLQGAEHNHVVPHATLEAWLRRSGLAAPGLLVACLAAILGGMAILALLVWLTLRSVEGLHRSALRASTTLRAIAFIGLVLLAVQIGLGGGVSANYAGRACPDLPLCRGELLPSMDSPTVSADWDSAATCSGSAPSPVRSRAARACAWERAPGVSWL